MVRVVYIMGSGRSGSTFLDAVLGSHPEIEGVGELAYLTKSGWSGALSCACGKRGDTCAFWRSIRLQWLQRAGLDGPEEYIPLQSTFERFRQWPRLIKERYSRSAEYGLYGERTRALFEAIGEVSGKSIIVDSSKNPVRATALAMTTGIDLRVIHLVRDGRGVAWSGRKPFQKDEQSGILVDIKPHPIWRTAVEWSAVNLLSGWVRHQVDSGKSILIRYEDLMSNPVETLNKVGRVMGCDLSEVAGAVSRGEAMEIGHTIAGNRLRTQGRVKMRPDTEWMSRLSAKDRRVFWVLAGWMMRRYQYTYM